MKVSNWLYGTLLLACLLVTMVFFGLAYQDYTALATTVNTLAADGEVISFTHEFHSALTSRAFCFAIFFSLLLLLNLFFLRRISAYLNMLYQQLKPFYSGWRKYRNYVFQEGSKFQVVLFALILMLAVITRGLLLNEPVIYDEAFTYNYYATRPFYVVLSDYSYPNNHILHTLLVKCSTGIFGLNHYSLRLPAFLASIWGLYICYPIFNRILKNRNASLIALSIISFSGVLIEYGVLARGYSLILLFTLLSIGFAYEFVCTNKKIALVGLVISTVLGFYTIPTMLYSSMLVFGWALWLYWRDKGRFSSGMLLGGILSAAFTILLYSPVIAASGLKVLYAHPLFEQHSLTTLSESLYSKATYFFRYYTPGIGVGIIPPLVLLSFLGFWKNKTLRLMTLMVLVLVPVILIQAIIPPVQVWSFLLILVALLIGEGGGFLISIKPPIARQALVIMLIIGFINVIPLFKSEKKIMRHARYKNTESAVNYLGKITGDKTRIVVLFPQEAPLEFYYRKNRMSIDPLYLSYSASDSFVIVTNKKLNQSPENVWSSHGFPFDKFDNSCVLNIEDDEVEFSFRRN